MKFKMFAGLIILLAATLAVGQAKVDTTGLTGWYPFNGNAVDASGHGHDGTVYGAALTDDRSGNPNSAYFFDGTNDQITLWPAQALGLYDHDFTVSAWVNGSSYSSRDAAIVANTYGSNSSHLHLIVRNGRPLLGFNNNDTYAKAATLLQASQWYHLVYRYAKSSGLQAIFVNGSLDTMGTGHASYTGTDTIHIGCWLGARYFYGTIDDIRIFSRALADSEIAALSLEGGYMFAPDPISPVNNQFVNSHDVIHLWHKADSAVSYRIQVSPDSTFGGVEHEALVAAPDTADTARGLIFTNYSWRVKAYRSSGDSSDWSPIAKYRIDTIPPAVPALVSPADASEIPDSMPRYHWNAPAGGARHYQVQVAADSLFVALIDSATVDSSGYTARIAMQDTTYRWQVRAADTAGNWSAYSAVWRYTVNTFTPVLVSPANGGQTGPRPAFDWKDARAATGYSIEISSDSLFAARMDSASVPSSAYVSPDSMPDTAYFWRVRAYRGAADTSQWSSTWRFRVSTWLPFDSLMAWYPFSDNARDSSGHGFHGTVAGATLTTDRFGSANSAYSFNGASHISTRATSTLRMTNHDFTVSGWIKASSVSGDQPMVGNLSGTNSALIHLILRSGRPLLGFNFNDTYAKASTILQTNRWYHLVFRYNTTGGEQAIFVNGTLDTAGTGHSPYAGTDTLYIGQWLGGNFSGVIDDIRIYDRALTAAEITALYHEGGYTGVEQQPDQIALPQSTRLDPSRPNPARNKTLLSYQLTQAGPVVLEVYNVAGQRVATLVNGTQNAGQHSIAWNLSNDKGSPVANGIYVVRLTTGALTATNKITVLH